MPDIKCPKCGAVCGESDLFCGSCGSQLSDVSPVQPEVVDFEPEPEKEYSPAALFILETFPGLLRPLIIVATILATVAALGTIGLSLFLLQMGGMIAAFAVGAAAVLIYWTGLCWMLCGEFCLPVEAMVDFTEKHWVALVLLTTIPGGLFLGLVKLLSSLK